MSSFSPMPEHIPDSIVYFMECFTGYDSLVIIGPSCYNWVQNTNQVFLFPCFSSLDFVTDICSNFFNRFLRWFNKKLTIILSEIPSQKVKASINMGYYRFLI